MKLESKFQGELIKEIKERFPGCYVLKNDPNYIQGFPDLTVLYEDKWAVLECKRTPKSTKRPNQDFYISRMNQMSFGRFINPENKEEVLNAMARSFETQRNSRIPVALKAAVDE